MLKIGESFSRDDARVFLVYTNPATGEVLGSCWDGEVPEFLSKARASCLGDPAYDRIAVGLRPLLGSDSRAVSDLMVVHGRKGGGRVKIGSVQREKLIRSVVYLDGPVQDAAGLPVERITADNYGLFRMDFLNTVSKAVAEVNKEIDDGDDDGLGE